MNVTPTVSRPTAMYLSLQFINANPMTKMAGKRFPNTLNNFLVFVLVRNFFLINISAIAPEILIFSQKAMYGNDERIPF